MPDPDPTSEYSSPSDKANTTGETAGVRGRFEQTDSLSREWLIALNASDHITRSALCRLAVALDRWCGLSVGDPGISACASALGIPMAQMRKALTLQPQVAELAARETDLAQRQGCRILTQLDDDYPPQLTELALPPPVLYVRGVLPTGPAVAIIGSRRLDRYGREVAECFARELASRQITIVSGFAIGIDEIAHRAAVQAKGSTVAILGCGLDVDYPRGRQALSHDVCQQGALISEFPLGAPPRRWHFPIRNRVIAALANSTLVVQATLRSGTLITAHHALELGRDVYAVPGRIFDERALGTNALLADGALVARTPEDLLASLPFGQLDLFPRPATEEPKAPSVPQPRGPAGKVLSHLSNESTRTAEELASLTELSVDRVLSTLLELELGGWVRRFPGPCYSR